MANNAFALDLYGRVAEASASENVVVSPVSASLVLTMTYAGAQGSTATEMATALHYGSSESWIFEGQNGLSQALESRANTALASAQNYATQTLQTAPDASNFVFQILDSIWGEETYAWNASFLDTMASEYGTGVYEQDFIQNFEPARQTINAWVTEQTSNKVNNLLPPQSLDTHTRMVLVNAVHLKFPWQSTFSAASTMPGPFTTGSGASVATPIMTQTSTLPYVDDGDAQIVMLPVAYGQLGVVITLPYGDLASYEAGLTAMSTALTGPKTSQMVRLSLPKTSFTTNTMSFKPYLQAMGMTDAFDEASADFSGLALPQHGDGNLYVKDVLQKATLEMDETGVEAAAATAVIVDEDSGISLTPPEVMNVDRPYLVSIVDLPTGALLFLGHITDPTMTGTP